jgi:hypothetical protein
MTSWGTDRSATANLGIMAAALATPSGSTWSVNTVLPFQLAPANIASTFPARVEVKAGQSLGYVNYSSQPLICSTGNAGDTGTASSVMTAGTNFVDSPVTTYRADISAVIEPDADNDGYGDETQDKCPQSAAFQNACPVLSISQQLSASSKKIKILATASVDSSLTATAKVALSSKKSATIKSKATSFAAGKLKTITLSLPSSVKTALKNKSLKATVTLTGNGLANTATATSKVTLKKT